MPSIDPIHLDQYRRRFQGAADTIGQACHRIPDLLIVLGSGLGPLAGEVSDPVTISYKEIPGFPASTVPGHAGQLVIGDWAGKYVAVMQGRFHYYEGHQLDDIVLPIRVMQQLGVPSVILTNAAGGVDPAMHPGDLMLIRDHISIWAESPLRGSNLDEFGPRFPDQSQVYDRQLASLAVAGARDLGIPLHQGVYAYCKGPQFETPAEIRMMGLLGASAVGMSTVPEAMVASHGGMRVLALSCITNLAAGLLDQPLSHQEVLSVGERVAGRTIQLLSSIISQMPGKNKE